MELHCRLFSLQYACAKAWLDCGLEVDTLVGHSFGQLTALCVANAVSLRDGLRLISTRARLIRDQWGPDNGAMIAIEGDREYVETLLASTREQHPKCSLEIACYNGPRSFVLSGDIECIEDIGTTSKTEEFSPLLKALRLHNTHAFHSPLVDSILPQLDELAGSIHFRKPSIRIETCSSNESWTRVSGHEVVQHSRLPVHFDAAVERITARSGSCVWLEAGSASPIVVMIRRVLQSKPPSRDAFLPLNLSNSEAQSNLARASCELWTAGSKAQFWPFHYRQRESYSWVTLSPYQFEQTRHWMEYKEPTNMSSQEAISPMEQKPELLRKVKEDKNQILFSIDLSDELFDLCTKGHAVLNYGLCPASMYFEFAVRGVRLSSQATSTKTLPRIQEMKMSSPLSLKSSGNVFLQLERHVAEDEIWRFDIYSQKNADSRSHCSHASGTVSLLDPNIKETQSDLQSLNRLIGSSRCDDIMKAPTATGLYGAVVYKTFSRIVEYATYYRGVQKVFAKDHEAVGHVDIANDQPPQLDSAYCDPIAIDNFLQVSGIHVNCLWECKDDEVFVCTAIRTLSFSEQFLNKAADKRSWTVYSNFELGTSGQVINDIFVLEPNSGKLVLTLMGTEFTSLPFKSLAKTLSKLNIPEEKGDDSGINDRKANTSQMYRQNDQPEFTPGAVTQEQTDLGTTESSFDQLHPDESQTLQDVRKMMSEVLEVTLEEVQPHSTFDDLGVDSLMVTEVLGEIKSRFNKSITNGEFQHLTDIQSLCHCLQPPISGPKTGNEETPSVPKESADASLPKPHHILINSTSEGLPDLAPLSLDCFGSVEKTFDETAKQVGFVGFCDEVYPLQAKLVLSYVVEAFTVLGCHLASLDNGQCLPDLRYNAQHTKVVGQLYKILESGRLIRSSAASMYRTGVGVPEFSAETLHAEIVARFPQHLSEHKLLHTTGSKLAACLNGGDDPISLLFGNPDARALMTDVYTNAPMFKTGTIMLGNYLADIFDHMGNDHEIRILELGAGTGGTTSYLVDLLARKGQNFQYTFTDLSSSLVNAAKKKFAKYHFMKYTTLDIEQTPLTQHLDQYDIIISTNCIHATKNLTTSTAHIKSMLRQDGILCLVELTRNLFWFDLVFGLLEGWWLFNDGRKHVLAKEDLWEQSLHRAGFQWVGWTDGDAEESQILRVIVASTSKAAAPLRQSRCDDLIHPLVTRETMTFADNGGAQLLADVYYPSELDGSEVKRPIGEQFPNKYEKKQALTSRQH